MSKSLTVQEVDQEIVVTLARYAPSIHDARQEKGGVIKHILYKGKAELGRLIVAAGTCKERHVRIIASSAVTGREIDSSSMQTYDPLKGFRREAKARHVEFVGLCYRIRGDIKFNHGVEWHESDLDATQLAGGDAGLSEGPHAGRSPNKLQREKRQRLATLREHMEKVRAGTIAKPRLKELTRLLGLTSKGSGRTVELYLDELGIDLTGNPKA